MAEFFANNYELIAIGLGLLIGGAIVLRNYRNKANGGGSRTPKPPRHQR